MRPQSENAFSKSRPFIYIVDFWHWLQFEMVDRCQNGSKGIRTPIRMCIWFAFWFHRSSENKRSIYKKKKIVNIKHLLLKPQIKIRITLKRMLHIKLPFHPYETNWFSWSANIYTCMLQIQKPINSILIPIQLKF